MPRAALGMEPDIGVVIAGNGCHAARWPEVMQPLCGADEFLWQPEIDQVSSHRDVVWLPLGAIVGEQIEDLAPGHVFAAAMAVPIAEHALGEEVAAFRARHRAQRGVAEMGGWEHWPTSCQ